MIGLRLGNAAPDHEVFLGLGVFVEVALEAEVEHVEVQQVIVESVQVRGAEQVHVHVANRVAEQEPLWFGQLVHENPIENGHAQIATRRIAGQDKVVGPELEHLIQ